MTNNACYVETTGLNWLRACLSAVAGIQTHHATSLGSVRRRMMTLHSLNGWSAARSPNPVRGVTNPQNERRLNRLVATAGGSPSIPGNADHLRPGDWSSLRVRGNDGLTSGPNCLNSSAQI